MTLLAKLQLFATQRKYPVPVEVPLKVPSGRKYPVEVSSGGRTNIVECIKEVRQRQQTANVVENWLLRAFYKLDLTMSLQPCAWQTVELYKL